MDKSPITEQLTIWGILNVWQGAHVKKIRLPDKLTTLRQKLYRKAKNYLRVPFSEVHRKAGCGKSACPV
ncbi:MAG: hypothetical protein U5R49_03560 [Deltaproteobacteria bacterium]|nr:hypothetical protein [Deltaproteobacteria bacterium]